MKTTILFIVLLILCFAANTQNVGIGTSTPRARLHVADSSVLFTAPATLPANAGNTPVIGPGHRMMWFANKAALRLGRTTGNQSDAAQIGQLSFAAGQDNIVSGFASAAFGTVNKLSSGYNFAAGYGNETRSVTAAAFGFNNLVKAQHGFAIGLHNDTSDNANPNVAGTFDRLFQIGNGTSGNNRSNAITVLRNGNTGIGIVNPASRLHVADSAVLFSSNLTVMPVNPSPPPLQGAGVRMMWYPQKAAFRAGGVDDGTSIGLPGIYPLEENNWNKDSIGTYSFASGYNTKSKGFAATAVGYRTNAIGDYSTAMGFYSTANGLYATAFGLNTVASGTFSTAMGHQSIASGTNSTAMGYQSIASGPYSTATGEQTKARGGASTSMGVFTQAKAYGAVTLGMYNDSSDAPNPLGSAPSDRIFQIGNGTFGTRSNALTVLRNGNTGVGITDPAYILDISTRMRIRGAPGFTAGLWLNNEANTAIPAFIGMFSDNQVGFFGNGGVGWGFLWNTQTGNATLSGSLTQNSDARLKKDIVPLSNSLETIQQLSGYSYHWKDASNTEEQIGLLAQEIQKVYPQLVKENVQGTLSVNYSGMVPVLLEAIKEQQKQSEKQQKEYEEQQVKIEKQQNELDELKKMIQQLINTKQ